MTSTLATLYLLSFFFTDPATTEIYTLSLTTLFRSTSPASGPAPGVGLVTLSKGAPAPFGYWYSVSLRGLPARETVTVTCADSDRKSTRLNSSHPSISYAVFCLKKKKKRT